MLMRVEYSWLATAFARARDLNSSSRSDRYSWRSESTSTSLPSFAGGSSLSGVGVVGCAGVVGAVPVGVVVPDLVVNGPGKAGTVPGFVVVVGAEPEPDPG